MDWLSLKAADKPTQNMLKFVTKEILRYIIECLRDNVKICKKRREKDLNIKTKNILKRTISACEKY